MSNIFQSFKAVEAIFHIVVLLLVRIISSSNIYVNDRHAEEKRCTVVECI